MSDVFYQHLVRGVHGQDAVNALMQKASVVTVPGATGIHHVHRLLLRIDGREWFLDFLTAHDVKQRINAARNRLGRNVVTPELLLKQDEALFWSMMFHGSPDFRRFLGGDIGVIQ